MRECNQVLVVDDNEEIVFAMEMRLRAAGYRPLSACDGEEGVRRAVDQRPDAIILDLLMPKMNGLEAMAELREHRETTETPIIMLSASLRDKQRALEAGARFFLTKPCAHEELLKALEAALADPPAMRKKLYVHKEHALP